MNYMLLVYLSEDPEVQKALGPMPEGCEGLAERLGESGQYLSAGILHSTSSATVVRVREGKRLITDGPFAETREQLAGYLAFQANDLDEAIGIAAQHPIAQLGSIEVRPIFQIPNIPPSSGLEQVDPNLTRT